MPLHVSTETTTRDGQVVSQRQRVNLVLSNGVDVYADVDEGGAFVRWTVEPGHCARLDVSSHSAARLVSELIAAAHDIVVAYRKQPFGDRPAFLTDAGERAEDLADLIDQYEADRVRVERARAARMATAEAGEGA